MDAHELAEAAYRRAVEVCERILQEMEEVLGHGKAEDEPGRAG